MKKNILSLSAIALIAFVSVFTGCKKTDTTPPVVTLTGAATETISLQGTYTELGATANDDVDGTVTATPSGTVNTDLTGTYVITYTATDKAGNNGTAIRTITVVNDAAIYAGTYTCTDAAFGSNSPFTQTVTASTTTNKHIIFGKFADFSGNTTIEAVLTGGTYFVLVPASNVSINGCNYNFTPNGNGNTISTSGGKASFSIKYNEEDLAGGTGCTAVAPTPYEDTFVQQ